MSDDLAKLDPAAVAAFYRRLASSVDANKGDLKASLAALLLYHWLDNRDPHSTFDFEAPVHLKSHKLTIQALQFHRRVYLSQEQARFTGNIRKWAGVLPRLQGAPGFAKWNPAQPLKLEYQSLVEVPLHYQITGSDADRDILYALHGYQVKTYVTLRAEKVHGSPKLKLWFDSFEADISDRYDWDYSEHLTVPNPDFGSKQSDAVAPGSKKIVVYHSNAKRIEDAGLAAPYDLRSKRWRPPHADLVKPELVDPGRRP